MTIYVDAIRNYSNTPQRYKRWSHMMTDQEEMDELHDMARKIGHKADWFQPNPVHPHYDLVPSKRALAIKYGAIPVSANEIVELCSYERKVSSLRVGIKRRLRDRLERG
jgi:hypothetical protein